MNYQVLTPEQTVLEQLVESELPKPAAAFSAFLALAYAALKQTVKPADLAAAVETAATVAFAVETYSAGW